MVLSEALVWRIVLIKSYELCQVRKEAAISSVFMQKIFSIEELKRAKTTFVVVEVKQWHIQHYIENLDQKHFQKW